MPEVGDDRPELDFVVDLPEDWSPPPAAARAILVVMLAVQERRASSDATDQTDPPDPLAHRLGPPYKV